MKSDYTRRQFLRITAGAAALGTTTALAFDQPLASGVEQPELAALDELMTRFLADEELNGAAMAVTRQGRLVYARGFGLADRDSKDAVQPGSLFRIASISKPITAVAILQLVESGRLSLDAHICDVLELRETTDERWPQITIRQLLQHTGGWDRDKSFDPMFRSVLIAKSQDAPPPAMPAQIIRYMCDQMLDFDPGTQYAYSNFGYSLLGRVIERITGVPYEQYVREKVFAPIGIRQARLGKTLRAERAPHEVCYYDRKDRQAPAVMGEVGSEVPLPYGVWCLEAMDSHGGWIASAVELVRFAAAFDQPEKSPLLRAATIETMFARPPAPVGTNAEGEPKRNYYGCGWSVRMQDKGLDAAHNGALDGTSTVLVHRHDGINWAVLFNNRQTIKGRELAATVEPLVRKAIDGIENWPSGDQFERWL